MKKCQNCGCELTDNVNFCPNCRARVASGSETPERPDDKVRKHAAASARATETGAAGVSEKSYTDSLFNKKKNNEGKKFGASAMIVMGILLFYVNKISLMIAEKVNGKNASSNVSFWLYVLPGGLVVAGLIGLFVAISEGIDIDKALFEFLRREIDDKRE